MIEPAEAQSIGREPFPTPKWRRQPSRAMLAESANYPQNR